MEMGDVLAYITGRQQLSYGLKYNLSYSWCSTRVEIGDLSQYSPHEAEKFLHYHEFSNADAHISYYHDLIHLPSPYVY